MRRRVAADIFLELDFFIIDFLALCFLTGGFAKVGVAQTDAPTAVATKAIIAN